MTDQWIEWADRDDLECVYLVVTTEYEDIQESIYILGKVPNEYFDKIIYRAWEELYSDGLSDIEIKTETQICHNDKLDAMRFYWRYKTNNVYLTVLNIVKYFQEKDYQIFNYHNKFLEEIAEFTSRKTQPLTVDAADQSGAANQTQTKIIDYSTIKDHKERRVKMFTDGIKPSDISRWEKENIDEISTSKNPLPSTDIRAIKKCIQRAQKAGTK